MTEVWIALLSVAVISAVSVGYVLLSEVHQARREWADYYGPDDD